MDELPPGWVQVTLGELGTWVGGGTPSKSVERYWQDGTIPWISPKDMKVDRISNASDYITPEAVANSTTRLVPPESVLVVIRSGILEHSLPVAISVETAAINQDLKALISGPHVDASFVALALKSFAQDILRECSKAGTTVANVSLEKLQVFPIALPPLAEQHRIVARIGALFAHTRRARAELGRVGVLAGRYERQLLASAFDEAAETWPVVPLATLITAIEAGKNIRCEERRPATGERGIVKISAVTWGEFDPTQIKTAPPEAELDPRSLIRNGDFLLSRANTLELVGAPAIARNVPERTHLSDKVLRLRFEQDVAEWVLWFLRSPRGRTEIEARASGNQLSMRNLGQAELRAIPIPLPPMDVRAGVVREITARMAKNQNGETESSRALALLERLDAAILARAFRGELVPQDPADEPAPIFPARLSTTRTPKSFGRNRRGACPTPAALP